MSKRPAVALVPPNHDGRRSHASVVSPSLPLSSSASRRPLESAVRELSNQFESTNLAFVKCKHRVKELTGELTTSSSRETTAQEELQELETAMDNFAQSFTQLQAKRQALADVCQRQAGGLNESEEDDDDDNNDDEEGQRETKRPRHGQEEDICVKREEDNSSSDVLDEDDAKPPAAAKKDTVQVVDLTEADSSDDDDDEDYVEENRYAFIKKDEEEACSPPATAAEKIKRGSNDKSAETSSPSKTLGRKSTPVVDHIISAEKPKSSKKASSSGIAIEHSVGRTRDQLNRTIKGKFGIFAHFGQSSFSHKDGSFSHMVLTDQWNVLCQDTDSPQELYIGEGPGRLRSATVLESAKKAFPVFFAPKKSKGLIYYVGHWKVDRHSVKRFDSPVIVKDKPRQRYVELDFHHFNQDLAIAIADSEH